MLNACARFIKKNKYNPYLKKIYVRFLGFLWEVFVLSSWFEFLKRFYVPNRNKQGVAWWHIWRIRWLLNYVFSVAFIAKKNINKETFANAKDHPNLKFCIVISTNLKRTKKKPLRFVYHTLKTSTKERRSTYKCLNWSGH